MTLTTPVERVAQLEDELAATERVLRRSLKLGAEYLEQLTAVQQRCTELLEENRRLKLMLDKMRFPLRFGAVIEDVLNERHRQNTKWKRTFGVWDDDENVKALVLAEEFGEVIKALNDFGSRSSELREELVQVAAVCVAWLETLVGE